MNEGFSPEVLAFDFVHSPSPTSESNTTGKGTTCSSEPALSEVEGNLLLNRPSRRRHPERSRSSGEARDLPCAHNRPFSNCTTTSSRLPLTPLL